jgi:ParB-like chromosome segregation protein Spo0J
MMEVARETTTMPVDVIRVEPRLREDMGDIAYLAMLIEAAGGILQPLVVTSDGRLLAGWRRLLAARKLQMTHVPVRVVAEEDDHADQS